MYNDNIRNKIIEIGKKNECLQELFQMLSREAMIYYCPCISEETLSEVSIGNDEYVVIATSENVLSKSKGYLEFNNYIKIDAISIIGSVLRKGNKGVVINLGDESQLILDTNMLKLLYREVIAMDLYMKGGAYVIQNDKDYGLLEIEEIKLFNIALTEVDAIRIKEQLNQKGSVIFKCWKEIFPYFVMSKCNALVYNFNSKDMVLIGEPYLGWLYDSPFQQLKSI